MSPSRAWWLEVQVGCDAVAAHVGLRLRRNHLPACPFCGAAKAGSGKLYRGRDGRTRFYCHRCEKGGDAVCLASLLLFGVPSWELSGERRQSLCGWFIERGWLQPGLPRGPLNAPRRPTPQWLQHQPTRQAMVEHPRPSSTELRRLCRDLVDVNEDERTARFLTGGGFDPEVVARQRLARAIPRHAWIPRWAHFLSHPWPKHWPLVFPVYGQSGRMESLRARWVEPEPPKPPLEKAAAAACGQGSATGLVLCNAEARDLLRGIRSTDPEEPIIIVEGETDFLTWATKPSVIAGGSVVIGLWSGSWTPEIADHIPDGAVIALRSDTDKAGDNYARRVQETLGHRCFLRRKKPVEAP